MKSFYSLLVFFTILFVSCSDDSSMGPNEMGGTTNLELTKVGNEYGVYVKLNGQNVNIQNYSAIITKNDNGIVTLSINASLKNTPYEAYSALIPAEFKDGNGDIHTDITFKVTSEGIQDFYHGGGNLSKPFTIAKYDCKMGDKYTFKMDDGTVITRTITEKTDKDEFPLGMMYIKTAETTQDMVTTPGFKKMKFRTNHKYGLVGVSYILDDNSEISATLLPWGVL